MKALIYTPNVLVAEIWKKRMNKNFAVIFHETGARILVGDVDSLKGQANVLIKPDLSEVKGLPPHKWDLLEGKVVKADKQTIDKREILLNGEGRSEFSHDNVIESTKYYYPVFFSILAFIAGAAASFLLAPLF